MYEPILPQGEAAALMPGASYSVPGLFLYADLVYAALDQVKAKFDYDIPVKYIYGSPQVRWNCGRPVLVDHGYTDADLEAELQKAVDRGITPLLPFSAPELTQRGIVHSGQQHMIGTVRKRESQLLQHSRNILPHVVGANQQGAEKAVELLRNALYFRAQNQHGRVVCGFAAPLFKHSVPPNLLSR